MLLITHDGKFHLDEVLATAVLLRIHPQAEIIRTRNRKVIRTGNIVYDVGERYIPEKGLFDHHQASFNETFSPGHGVKLSSSGLIYKHYGEQFLNTYGIGREDRIYQRVYEEIYERYFLSADAIDNGYEVFGKIIPRSLSHVVDSFNHSDFSPEAAEEQNERFMKAVEYIGTDLDNFVHGMVSEWVPCYAYLDERIRESQGEMVVVSRHCPMDLVLEMEQRHSKDIKYVLNPTGSSVTILAVPKAKGRFGSKVPLKEEWRGLSGSTLEEHAGIEGCLFVHTSGFVGANRTLEGAVEMCVQSIKAHGVAE
jgi:uncharacterized UPF0160 family protein